MVFVEKRDTPAKERQRTEPSGLCPNEIIQVAHDFCEGRFDVNSNVEFQEYLNYQILAHRKAFTHFRFRNHFARIQPGKSVLSRSGNVSGYALLKQVEFQSRVDEAGCPRAHVAPQSRWRRCLRIY